MYYARTPLEYEALFISRTQQRIAELGAQLAEEFSRNDVDNYKAELIVELEYAIEVLYSTELDWTPDDIRMMIDYYTEYAELTAFGFRSMVFEPTKLSQACDCDTILTMIQNINNTAGSNYDYFSNWINQVNQDWQDGDTAIWDYINNIVGGAPVLAADLTSGQNTGGILEGDQWAEGDLIENVLRDLLKPLPTIENFTFDSWVDLIEIGETLTINQFSWDSSNAPENITISDSEGTMVDVPVTGNVINLVTPYTYDFSTGKTVTWTIKADKVEPISIEVTSVYASYFDKEPTATDAAVTITESKVLNAATKILSRTSEDVTLPVSTSNTEQGFIAVAKAQSFPDYTKWRVNDNNNATIGVGEFIRPPVDVIVEGVTYSAYRWGYRSPLVDNLKLLR